MLATAARPVHTCTVKQPERPSVFRRAIALVVTSVAAAALVLSTSLAASAQQVDASVPASASAAAASTGAAAARIVPAELTGFSPGNIIDDGVFYNSATMSQDDIQRFLDGKVTNCESGYTCLKNWRGSSRTIAADPMCRAYNGSTNESAASVIFKVAQACGINPQVLIVMLQKEQALVTHRSPSSSRYQIAMGQGCPDTAACDTRYYGFFNQVYGAAWQLRRYTNPPGTSAYFTWYAPGATRNLRFHPDAACGSSPVFVSNQATASLYYYTPYQPNRAALAAGYGEGDDCSAYGNRNFYNYFTDWFGSTRGSGIVLARTAADPAVYLLSGGRRWHVVDGGDLSALSSVFGPVYTVAGVYLSDFARSGSTGSVLRDESTGELALFQDRARHRFPSCELVQLWGADCAKPVTVASSLFRQASSGSEMTSFYRVRDTGRWGRIDSARAVTPLWNEAAARSVNGNPSRGVFGAYATTALLSGKTSSPLLFAPAQVVKSTSSDRVYLTIDQNSLRWIRSWDDVAEYNRDASTLAVVSNAELLGGRYREVGAVEPTLRCSGATYFPAGGTLHAVRDPDATGLRSMPANAATCAQFTRGAAFGKSPLIKVDGDSTVAAVENGKRRTVTSWRALTAYLSGTPATIATVAPRTFSGLAAGAPVADGDLVKGSSPAVMLVAGSRAFRIPNYEWAADAGLAMSFVPIGDGDLGRLTTAAAPLGLWVTCGGSRYVVGSGGLSPVTATASQGFATQALSAAGCARFPVRSGTLSAVFVKSPNSDRIYAAQNGVFRHVQSWATLTSLAKGEPKILSLSDVTMGGLPTGTPMP